MTQAHDDGLGCVLTPANLHRQWRPPVVCKEEYKINVNSLFIVMSLQQRWNCH